MDLPSTPVNISLEESQCFVPGAAALATGLGQATNYVLDFVFGMSIGSIMQSVMTEAQFQAVVGTGWKLCDGQSCAGSAYDTLTGNATVPDFRARVMRGKNNGRSDGNEDPNGELALGTLQAQTMVSHAHSTTVTNNVGSTDGSSQSNAGGIIPTTSGAIAGVLSFTLLGPTNVPTGSMADTSPTAGSEFRPRSTIVNFFLRVD